MYRVYTIRKFFIAKYEHGTQVIVHKRILSWSRKNCIIVSYQENEMKFCASLGLAEAFVKLYRANIILKMFSTLIILSFMARLIWQHVIALNDLSLNLAPYVQNLNATLRWATEQTPIHSMHYTEGFFIAFVKINWELTKSNHQLYQLCKQIIISNKLYAQHQKFYIWKVYNVGLRRI